MNLAAYSPPHALRKALKARRGRRSPIGQNNDWQKLTRRETELQSAYDFANQKRKT